MGPKIVCADQSFTGGMGYIVKERREVLKLVVKMWIKEVFREEDSKIKEFITTI